MNTELLYKLRQQDMAARLAEVQAEPSLLDEFLASGISFAATSDSLESRFYQAVAELFQCTMAADHNGKYVWLEGGPYRGCWLESTGTINSEVASRFIPSVSQASFELYADLQRDDGLMPYKWTKDGPAYKQIQLVTPLARSVWNHYLLHGRKDKEFLGKMFHAMRRYDAWLHRNRTTRGTGCIEAFCTFDTGHDSSSRFWHVPDTPHLDNPAEYDPDSPILPFLAPDLTANVACQRDYLARIAQILGEDPQPWRRAHQRSVAALFAHCFDETDGMFYDRDRTGALVRVQSDVLLRVLACEIGDSEFFESSLRNYLLNTRKFFAQYPFTSIALDDPRFSQDFSRNSWAGPSNFLSLLRAPHAFEHHGHHVELTWAMMPVLAAVCRMTRFPQTLNPWTGEQGFTEQYSPAILWTLDAVERLAGVLPRPDGEVWCTALLPNGVDHHRVADAVAYGRIIESSTYEFIHDGVAAVVYRDGQVHATFPAGWRLVRDRAGDVRAVVGMSARTVSGRLVTGDYTLDLTLAGNERVDRLANEAIDALVG